MNKYLRIFELIFSEKLVCPADACLLHNINVLYTFISDRDGRGSFYSFKIKSSFDKFLLVKGSTATRDVLRTPSMIMMETLTKTRNR